MIPQRAKQLNSAKGFYEVWIENLSKEDLSHHEAYLKTEEEYREHFGAQRYSSYDSFRISQRKRIFSNKIAKQTHRRTE